MCACFVWSYDHLEYVLIVQVNHCHEEQLARLKQEMERIIASKDDEITQLPHQNQHLVSYCNELHVLNMLQTQTEHVTKEKETEMASKDEQIALLQLGNKELTDLQEEIQAKNQQVKQYKKQVDSYKAELERCQKELERCQGELLEVDGMGAMVPWLVMWLVDHVHVSVYVGGVHAYVCTYKEGCVHTYV